MEPRTGEMTNDVAEHMFYLTEVRKSYPGTVALTPLTVSIDHGERVALMGPSGSGKSTLLRILAGIIPPDDGALWIAGKPASQLHPGPELARLVGIMPQSLDLVPSLSVVHNVNAGRLGDWGFWRSLWSLLSPRGLDRVEMALARVGILDKLYERTSHLSGGEQQRVALARLLVQRPRAILADEPVASVDPARAEDLIALMVELANEQSQTLVASMHSVHLALRYFSRIIALRDGAVIFDRPVSEVTEPDLDRLYSLEDIRDVIG